MKKDLKSYKKHNKQYYTEHNSYENTLRIIEEYNKENVFRKLGFELAIKLSKDLPSTHVDIGSGTGWLLRKTSPIFEKVIAVEPSEKALEISRKINKDNQNIIYINNDMIDALNDLKLTEPVFITTATVLSHIKDYYVSEFLKLVNDLPMGSVLFFDERYDSNMNFPLWHIRNKSWWVKNLSNWQLIFLNLEMTGYASGVFGIKVEREKLLTQYKYDFFTKIVWKINFVYNIILKILNKIWKIKK